MQLGTADWLAALAIFDFIIQYSPGPILMLTGCLVTWLMRQGKESGRRYVRVG